MAATTANPNLLYQSAATGSVSRTYQSKFTDYVSALDFGADSTGTNDTATALGNTKTASWSPKLTTGTYKINSTVTLNDSQKFIGEGERVSIIQNNGTGTAIQTPVSTPGGAKSFYHRLADLQINGTNTTTPAAPALTIQQTGPSFWERLMLQNHQSAVKLEGAVGTVIDKSVLQQSTNGILAGGVSSSDAVTLTRVNDSVITTTTNALNINGLTRGMFLTNTDIESNTNLYTESGGLAEHMVMRNAWIEGVTNTNLGNAQRPVFDTPYFSGDYTISGGYAPTIRDAYVTGTTNFGVLKVTAPIADVMATSQQYGTTINQRGMHLQMPIIGSASTPEDRYAPAQTAQSALIGELSGTLFGYSQPLQNLAKFPVNHTAYDGTFYWAFPATITTGQADLWGGTNSIKLSGQAYHGTSAFAVAANTYYTIEVAFSALNAGDEIGVSAIGYTGAMDKRLWMTVPDTNPHVMHMTFKTDSTTFAYVYLYFPTGGVVIHRVGIFQGAQMKPLIPEGSNYNAPFIMRFQNVESWASAAPTTGTWKQGDIVINTAPSAGAPTDWICTVGGTPGTWVANYSLTAAAPTISSGFGAGASIVNNNGPTAFEVNVGTGGTASTGVVGLPTAAHGWSCAANDETTTSSTVFMTKQTASTTTSVTLTQYNNAGAAAAWAASDILHVSCFPY